MNIRNRVAALAALILAPGMALADSIRVGDDWHVDVYVAESSQFYQILFPETGEIQQVSKKRSDVGTPRISKDSAERAALKQQWEEAKERGTRVQTRQTELRTGTRELTNLDQNGVPLITSRPSPELELTPDQLAARQRRMTQPSAPTGPPPSSFDAPASPPGPREAPREMAGPADGEAPSEEATQERMQEEQFMTEVERLMMEPYFYNDAEREVFEELRRTAQQRMQNEAYYWEALRSQGYMESQPYLGGESTSHSAQPEQQN